MPRSRFSNAEARRIALAAQGLDRPRPACAVNAGHIRRVIERLGLLQLDFVNVLVPAHELVPYSRLGPYDGDAFRRAVHTGGRFIEHWAHEASIVPVDYWPALQWRRDNHAPWAGRALSHLDDPGAYLDQALEVVRERGPVTTDDMPPAPSPAREPGDWHRSAGRWALEWHFGRGTLAVAERLPNFQRVYDLAERIVPESLHRTSMSEADGRRVLLERAAAALGIATTADLADYFRMAQRDAAPRLAELAEEGRLRPVEVDGWRAPAWLHRDARLPRRVDACTLLSPFDPLVWYRPRAERLFDFHYRIEIYVPEKDRRWGYYVLPFLLGDRLCARVDLKAERADGLLAVRAAHLEKGEAAGPVAEGLAGELWTLAHWLGLERIAVDARGDLAPALADALGAH